MKTVMHEVSKVRANAEKHARETFAADRNDERIVNEFSWTLSLPHVEALETFHIQAPVKSFSIEQLKSPEKTVENAAFPIGAGFSIGFATGESKDSLPTGWALKIRRLEGMTFSWEWFQQRDGTRYFKIQEGGEVEVQTRQVGDRKVIVATEFLTDVSLRFLDGFTENPDGPFGRVNIQKGVVLRWPVLIDGRVVLLD